MDADRDQESNTSTSTTTNTTTNSNNTSNTTNNTTNNSTTHNSDSRDDSSTVNNYDYSSHRTTENTYLPPSTDFTCPKKGGQASASQHQIITVDYGSIVDGIKVQEDGKNITINVNVNVDTNEKEEAEPQAVEVLSSNVEADPSSAASNITWTELVKICLLFGIFICVFRRPVAK